MDKDIIPSTGENEVDNIERLKKRLYAQEGGDFTPRRSSLDPLYSDIKKEWAEGVVADSGAPKKARSSFLLKVLVAAFIFFALAAGGAAFVFLKGINLISNNNIDVAIKGPTSIKAGDTVSLQIVIANKNEKDVNDVTLSATYPPGTRLVGDLKKELNRVKIDIGKISSGEAVNKTIEAVVFGKENTEQEIGLLVEYRLAGSNMLYQKEERYKIVINAASLNMTVLVPEEVVSNQAVTLNIKASPNSKNILRNVLLTVFYPPGFQYRSSNIKPTYGNNRWVFGDLADGAEKELSIKGILEGQDGEEKNFQVTAGMADDTNKEKVAVIYYDLLKTITISKPFLGVNLAIDDQTGKNLVIRGGQEVPVVMSWINNLSSSVINSEAVVTVEGSAVDRAGFKPGRAFYRSQDMSVLLNKNMDAKLAEIAPGDSRELPFSFLVSPLINDDHTIFKNPTITVTAKASGVRTSADASSENVHTVLSKQIKVETEMRYAAKSARKSGPFTNTGPFPPKVDKESTYTIMMSAVNSSNDVKDVYVKASLPPNVSYTGKVSPETENIRFDEATRELVWVVGYMSAGEGIVTPPKQVAFQVSLLPSLGQAGAAARLLSESTLTAYDTFTGTNVSAWSDELTTTANGDFDFNTDNEKVVK